MQRPRVKPVFPPTPIGEGKIRIGGTDLGLAAELNDDEQGHTWHLLHLLDGTRTRTEVVKQMSEFDSAVTADDVETAIAELTSAGYLEDAAINPPDIFNADELARYKRNFEFFSFFHHTSCTKYDFQARLKQSQVAVVGVGGLGSYTALALTALGVGDLLLVDHDVVELANLNRQMLYSSDDIGSFKADAAARRLAEVNPHVNVHSTVERVDGPQAVQKHMRGRDFVVCAADRPPLRIYEWFNEAALIERVPWIRGGNAGLTLSAFLHVPYQTACFDCVQRTAAEEISWFTPAWQYVLAHEPRTSTNPCTAPVAGLLGSIVALEVAKYLTGAAEPTILNRRLVLDLARMEITYADGVRRPDCPSCMTASVTDTSEAMVWMP